MQSHFRISILISLVITANACNNNDAPASPDNGTSDNPAPAAIRYHVLNTYPHDTSYFTEGLELHKGRLFESSGGNDSNSPYPSAFGIADLKTGKVTPKVQLDRSKYFGEGITIFKDKIYQLTWQTRIGFVYDLNTFKKLNEFQLPSTEGWGLTHDTANLIMSAGTEQLYFLNPETFRVQNVLSVIDNNGPVGNINELEYVNGFIYANQWLSDYILKIDAASGKVVGRVDLSALRKEVKAKYPDALELNGIAYDSTNKRFLVTGKKWPTIYEMTLQ